MTSEPPRTALVTGASRGIGRGIALALARQGYALTVTSRNVEDLLGLENDLNQAGAATVAHLPADLSDRSTLVEVVELHRRTHDSMDALILNGGVGTAGPVADYPLKRLDKT